MNTNLFQPKPIRPSRWLAAAGLALSLMAPLTANAEYRDNGAVEILVSAAIAYAVIDVAGGFDNKHRRDDHHNNDRYRDHRHKQHQRHYEHDRRYWAKERGHHRHKHGYRKAYRKSHRYPSGH